MFDHPDAEVRNTSIFAIANFACNPVNHLRIVKNNVLPKLVSLLRCDDRICQLRVVSTLRGLSTNAEIRLQILSNHALEPLLELTRSDDVEVQMETLSCLCNLSLSGCVGDNPSSFLNSCQMQTLIAFLCSADSTYRLFGALTIGMLIPALLVAIISINRSYCYCP
jgi:hypothetical protein